MQRARNLKSLIRLKAWITGSDHRVLGLPSLPPQPEAIRSVIRLVEGLDGTESTRRLDETLRDFDSRHRDLPALLEEHYQRACLQAGIDPVHTGAHRLLIGSYFTMEYGLEAAALFNPSIVPHPDQAGAPPGGLRVVMSLRAVGEGHLSSTVFREGTITPGGEMQLDAAHLRASRARVTPVREFDKAMFRQKLGELEASIPDADRVLGSLPERFSFEELGAALTAAARSPDPPQATSLFMIRALAHANYELHQPPNSRVAELVMFPQGSFESRGIEDLRMVRFRDIDGSTTYYGTYTAFDGSRILPMMMETRDFMKVSVLTLNGACARGKGIAIFPRRIRGHYAACSRIDGRNLYLMYSDHIHFWETASLLAGPREPWEYRLIGNCGSPIETPEGWLMLTHGVGPMRRYAIGAMLLDLEDPSRIRGRLRTPLLVPQDSSRDGYVPNVVYTCGALLHSGRLYIPYAVSDERTMIVRVNLDEILGRLLSDGAG